MNVLLTSASFQETPGKHHDLLRAQNYNLSTLKGPIKEDVLLAIIDQFDALICGDDEITARVLEKGANAKLKILSKYGIGLDKIDLKAAKKHNIKVVNCHGVNHITVAEHAFSLLLAFLKNIIIENNYLKQQNWIRLTGSELYGKTIGILGLGKIGKEIAIRASAFGLKILAYDKYFDEAFAKQYNIEYIHDLKDIFAQSDIISLNMYLDDESRNMINGESLMGMRDKVIIINTARAGLVDQNAIISGIESGKIGGYLTDVLEEEPMVKDHPFLKYDNIIITPHIGSRTFESVERQGTMAVENLIDSFKSLQG